MTTVEARAAAGPGAGVDRDPWLAGYEMGRLDAQLAARPVRTKAGLTIRAVNREAAAALATRHGYRLLVREAAERDHLWAEFWPL